ncbi:hypothetical protein H8E77_09645 [bacterium]|nr:hypothetical protein [bacterium]
MFPSRLRLSATRLPKTNSCLSASSRPDFLPLISSLLFFILTASVSAQNLILEFDGRNSYVQLPADIYRDLPEATIEAWVKLSQDLQMEEIIRVIETLEASAES